MFNINDEVIHKSAGACVIKDIITQNFGGGYKTYYFMRPKYETTVNKSLEIYLPVEKESEFIRKPITKTEVLVLINDIPAMRNIWLTDTKARKQMFDEIYQKGDLRGYCQLVKLLYLGEEFFTKPMSITDKNFLNRIRNYLFDEFALVLNMHPSEIEGFIERYLK